MVVEHLVELSPFDPDLSTPPKSRTHCKHQILFVAFRQARSDVKPERGRNQASLISVRRLRQFLKDNKLFSKKSWATPQNKIQIVVVFKRNQKQIRTNSFNLKLPFGLSNTLNVGMKTVRIIRFFNPD